MRYRLDGPGRAGYFYLQGPRSRGAFGGMAVMLLLFAVQKFFPKLFDNKIWYAFVLAMPVMLVVFSLYAGYIYNPRVALRPHGDSAAEHLPVRPV